MISALPWFTAVVFASNAVNITRLPPAPHDLKTTEERKVRVAGPGPLKNVGWLAASFCNGTLWTNQVILNLVIPLWLVTEDRRPLGACSRSSSAPTRSCASCCRSPRRAACVTSRRACARSGSRPLFFIVSCVITLSTHHTLGLLTVVLFFLGHVTLTGAELFLSAASWTFEAELMDPRRRGEYQGAAELMGTLGRVWAPALYTFLVMDWSSLGWLVIAALVTAAGAGLHPSRRAGAPLPRAARPRRRARRRDHVGPGRRARAAGRRRWSSSRPSPAVRARSTPCQNPPVTSSADWLAGARPRTLPAAVAPVLAGTGVAAYVDHAVWWKAAAGPRGEPRAAGRRQLRQRLLRRRPRHRRRPGRPDAARRARARRRPGR